MEMENFEIVLGTYEQYMLGYKVEKSQDDKFSIKHTFAMKSHIGSIRAVACCEKYLASAGSDDRIFIYDMNTRKEIQMLIHHTGTVNTICFTPKATHIISGSTDGSIAIVRTGNWQMEKLFKTAHKRSVNHVTVHPSGKLALSVGGDWVLRTWNLVKGRHAYATNLASRGPYGRLLDTVHFSIEGSFFTLTGSKKLEIWSIEKAEVVHTQELEAKIVSCCWISEAKLICGLEDGNFFVYDMGTKLTFVHKAHDLRIKCVAFKNNYAITCDSSGVIKLWKNYDNSDITELCSTNSSCRITCITVIDNSCLKKIVEKNENINKAVLEKENDYSDSDTENKSEPKVFKRKEVVIIEEEINEVKVPAGVTNLKTKKNKRKADKSLDIENSAEKQKKLKESKGQNNLDVAMNSDENDLEEENISVSTKSRKKKKPKLADSFICNESRQKLGDNENDFLTDELQFTDSNFGDQNIKDKKKLKKIKKNKQKIQKEHIDSLDLQLEVEHKKSMKDKTNTTSETFAEGEVDSKKSKKSKSKRKNLPSENELENMLEDVIINNNKTKNKKKKKEVEESELDQQKEHVHSLNLQIEEEHKKSKKDKLKTTSEILTEGGIDFKKNKKSKSKRKKLQGEDEIENAIMDHSKTKKKKVEENDSDQLNNLLIEDKDVGKKHKKKNKKAKEDTDLVDKTEAETKSKYVEDSGIECAENDHVITVKTKKKKTKK